jgi:hypothetical protein
VRINQAIRDELAAMGESMREEAPRLASARSQDAVEGTIVNWADEIENLVDIIDGGGGRLWRGDNWVDKQEENPLKQLPDVTLIHAARAAWDQVKDKPEGKRWFSALDMDKALRETLTDASWLPRFITGRQWSPYMNKLVKMGVVKKVPLRGPRSRKTRSYGYVLTPEFQRKDN